MGIHRNPDDVPEQFDDAVNRDGRRPNVGWVAPDVRDRLPDLALLWLDAPVEATTKSPVWAKERLRHLSAATRGSDVLRAHRDEAPAAYRELYRAIGRDPGDDPPPLEVAYRERLLNGGYPQIGLPADALTIVLAETGVPIWGVDADLVDGTLTIRRSVRGELPVPPGLDPDLTVGQPVVADDLGVVAELCRPVRPIRAIDRQTARGVFFTVRPAGVSDMRVHEAFWMCLSLLA